MQSLVLPRGATFLVTPSNGLISGALTVSQGYLRLASTFHSSLVDVTLAFSAPNQPADLWLQSPQVVVVEALTDAVFQFDSPKLQPVEPELIRTWLLSFALVRHCLGADQRVNQLLYLLADRFGIPSADGVSIPFLLSHSRIAELIGVTRPTVTRQLVRLRNEKSIKVFEKDFRLLLTNDFLKMSRS